MIIQWLDGVYGHQPAYVTGIDPFFIGSMANFDYEIEESLNRLKHPVALRVAKEVASELFEIAGPVT